MNGASLPAAGSQNNGIRIGTKVVAPQNAAGLRRKTDARNASAIRATGCRGKRPCRFGGIFFAFLADWRANAEERSVWKIDEIGFRPGAMVLSELR